MLRNGTKLATVKKQMNDKFNWWKFYEERKFPNGEINLYYKDRNSTVVFFFDRNLKLCDTSYFEDTKLTE